MNFILLLTCFVGCVVGIIIGSVNMVKGPKGTVIKDEETVNWLKEMDGPEEPLSEEEFAKVKQSYTKLLSNRPFYAALFFVIAALAVLVGRMASFDTVHIIIGVIILAVAAVVMLVIVMNNRKVFERERSNFTKKKAVAISSERISYLNVRLTTGTLRYGKKQIGDSYTLYLGVCNRTGEPRIFAIPVLSDVYSMAGKAEKFDVIMYKGEFSNMPEFMVKEETK